MADKKPNSKAEKPIHIPSNQVIIKGIVDDRDSSSGEKPRQDQGKRNKD